MHTARVLTVSPSMLCTGQGVYLVQGGVPGPGGCTWSWGVYLVCGGVPGPRGVYLVPVGVYLVPGGVPGLVGGVPGPGGCTWSQWVYLVPGGVRYPPPVNRMTNRCKNITLPQTSFAGGNKPKLNTINSSNHQRK